MVAPLDLIPLAPVHAAVIAGLHRACFDPAREPGWDGAAIGRLMGLPGHFGRIALAPATGPVGFILLRVAGDESEILSLGVVPGARGGGIGRRLLDVGAADARGHGARILFLEVAEDNGPARGLYAAFGFVQVGRRPAYYDQGAKPAVDALVLRADLDP